MLSERKIDVLMRDLEYIRKRVKGGNLYRNKPHIMNMRFAYALKYTQIIRKYPRDSIVFLGKFNFNKDVLRDFGYFKEYKAPRFKFSEDTEQINIYTLIKPGGRLAWRAQRKHES